MISERVILNKSQSFRFDLKTVTFKSMTNKLVTVYCVYWHYKFGGEVREEITKEEYDFLVEELKRETSDE